MTFLGIARARLMGRRRAVAPLFGAFLLAIALLVVLPETAYLCATAAFQSLLTSMPITTSAVQVQATALNSGQAISGFERDVVQRAANQGRGYLIEVAFHTESAYFPVNSHNGQPIPTQGDRETVLAFANHSDLQSHADLVAGSWSAAPPKGAVSVTMVDLAAARLNAKPGDLFCVSNGVQANSICVWIAGIWHQRDANSAYWIGDVSLPVEVEMSRSDLASPLTQGQSDYHQATAVFILNRGRIGQSDPADVQDSLAHLGSALTGNAPYRQVVTGLETAVAAFNDRSRVATLALQLITAQLWLVGLYCILFLPSIRLEQDRDAVAVWRTRGWPRSLVATMLSIELTTIAALALVPGAVLGFGLAVGITSTVYPGAELSIGRSVDALAPVLAGGFPALVSAVVGLSVIAARTGVVRARAESSRPRARWWAKPWVAGLAALVAIPFLVQARLLGDARIREASSGLPYDLLLPGIGMALLALAGISLLPVVARACGRVARGLEARLAMMQMARASGRQQRLSLLLAAAVALALLAAAYSGTATQNAGDRAGYAAGADLRVVSRGDQPPDLQALQIAGATAKTAVFRGYGNVGASRVQAQALGVDPYTFAKVAWTRPGLPTPDLGTLMRNLVAGERGGTLLPATATGLSIWVHGEQTGGSLTASFTDADLMPVTANFGTLDFAGWKQLVATFVPSHFKAPLRLRYLTLTPVTTAGTVGLSDLEATETGGGTAIVFEFDLALPRGAPIYGNFPGWWQSDGTTGSELQYLEADDRFLRGGHLTSHVFLSPGWLPVTVNPPVTELVRAGSYGQITSLPVPALVSSSLLAANQLQIGESISVQMGGTPVNALIVGSFDYFPTLYGDGLVFSLPPLLQVLGGSGDQRPWPTELWVSGSSLQLEADEPGLTANPQVLSLISRPDLAQQTAADPLGPAGRANLLLGFVAACLLAIAAFGIHFAFAARARASEYAILEANGLSPGQVARSVLIEQLLVVTFSTVLGLALGAALSLVLLPGLQISTSITDTIPPTVLAINPWLAISGIGITIAGCLLAGRLVTRPGRVADVMPELRSLG